MPKLHTESKREKTEGGMMEMCRFCHRPKEECFCDYWREEFGHDSK